MNDIKIAVASHKRCWLPKDEIYLPIQVGSCFNDSDIYECKDNTYDNIGKDNKRYCELTALYWLTKNINADFKGLVHYRRYFKGSGDNGVLTKDEANILLDKSPVILPKKRNYFIETIYSHYSHTFYSEHLDITRDVIGKICPEYLDDFDAHMNDRSGHMFNMMIMRSDILDDYLNWLFPILRHVEQDVDFTNLSDFDTRMIGRVAELLLDVWINRNQIDYVECPVTYFGDVNWIKKGYSFLAAKFFNKKYNSSF